ncbi:MAG: T9SS type A sorting domain-containing protein [Fidelibacterota bacterium]
MIDEFSSVWRNWVQNGNGPFELEYGTPFIHLGDFNYVGYNQQVETIKTGDIINENDFGVDFLPDWDSTAIIDLFSRQTHKRMGYTWRNDGSSFNPGKLDYIFYSDASIDTGKHYILNTLAIDQTDLDNYNLQLDDTQEASDHLPLVFDIIVSSNVGVGDDDDLPKLFRIYPNYPNPFNSTTKIDYQLPKKKNVQLVIFDILGRNVITLVDDILQPGYKTITWNGIDAFGNNVSAGMYFYMIQTGKNREVKKMVLLK